MARLDTATAAEPVVVMLSATSRARVSGLRLLWSDLFAFLESPHGRSLLAAASPDTHAAMWVAVRVAPTALSSSPEALAVLGASAAQLLALPAGSPLGRTPMVLLQVMAVAPRALYNSGLAAGLLQRALESGRSVGWPRAELSLLWYSLGKLREARGFAPAGGALAALRDATLPRLAIPKGTNPYIYSKPLVPPPPLFSPAADGGAPAASPAVTPAEDDSDPSAPHDSLYTLHPPAGGAAGAAGSDSLDASLFNAREVATILLAATKLGLQDVELLRQLLAATRELAHTADGRCTASSLYGMAHLKLGGQPQLQRVAALAGREVRDRSWRAGRLGQQSHAAQRAGRVWRARWLCCEDAGRCLGGGWPGRTRFAIRKGLQAEVLGASPVCC
jgi:hypothetical protein